MPFHPIDVQVGRRVRERRILLGITQTELASTVGLTFQQIQKYERGATRISASRLFEFATVLGLPVEHFFGGSSDEHPDKRKRGRPRLEHSELASKRETLKLVRAYYQIQDPALRQILARLITALA